ncbi:MAG TPA: 3-oxoacyl-[acyl-carrier-protein] synthase III C-terminal domain-containing protein [Steroidobacteraceae bacterium]|nr:3-oxoacyl-[acyl-carrier-protein] synthase III C-terminal domain-containing protein [Steroidobacteraceae bacterium]
MRRRPVPPEKLYFNISRVGNTSAASISIADAVREGLIGKLSRVLAPGFGAGAVAGYAIMRVDPRVIAPQPAVRDGRCDHPRALA